MQIDVTDNTEAHRFEASANGRPAGFIVYSIRNGQISLIHTEIDNEFEGKGVASTLVKRALGMVRDSGLPMLPVCPFVQAYVQRHPGYVDLVPELERARFALRHTTHSIQPSQPA